MLQLFLALWPDPATRETLASRQRGWTWPDRAALVPPGRLHLTLHFLGDVAQPRLAALVQVLQVPCEPFALELGLDEVWSRGVAVLRPESAPDGLLRLHAALAQRVASFDLPPDTRPYRPHVTLARRAAGARPPPQGPRLHWPIDQGYVLARSLPDGAGYQVLERFG